MELEKKRSTLVWNIANYISNVREKTADNEGDAKDGRKS